MTCPQCGKTNVRKRKARLSAEVKGERVEFPMRAFVCGRCGFTLIDGKDMPEYMRLAADAYRTRHGLLTSEEIRARRKALRMSQAKFAEHLGVGVASVKRWEMGKIQDRSSDRLIRALSGRTPARAENATEAAKPSPSARASRGRDKISVPIGDWIVRIDLSARCRSPLNY